MARISLARQQLADTGLMAAYSAAAAEGHSVENNGKVLLHVRNSNATTACTVTIRSSYTRGGLKLADRQVTVAASSQAFIGPFDTTTYNQTDGGAGQVYVDYSSVTDVTVAALLIP